MVVKLRYFGEIRMTKIKKGASPGIEPGTSRTLSENHASRPTGLPDSKTSKIWHNGYCVNTLLCKLMNYSLCLPFHSCR